MNDLPISERFEVEEQLQDKNIKRSLISFRSGNRVLIEDGEVIQVLLNDSESESETKSKYYFVYYISPDTYDEDEIGEKIYTTKDIDKARDYAYEYLSMKRDFSKSPYDYDSSSDEEEYQNYEDAVEIYQSTYKWSLENKKFIEEIYGI